jgi:hypothetical protein
MWQNWLEHEGLTTALAQFHHILLGCKNTCAAAERATGVPVTYVTPAIDMVRFCPVPNPPRRSIDVRSMGRRSQSTHDALYDWSERKGATYLYDSNLGLYQCDAYDDNFDWEDSVIEMPYGSKDAPEIIGELDRGPARLAKIRRDNVVNHLRRHDWAYRWLLVLERVAETIPDDGLTPNAAEMELYYQGLALKPL